MAVTVNLKDMAEPMTVGEAPSEVLLVGLPSHGVERVFFKTGGDRINYLNGCFSRTGLGYDHLAGFRHEPCRLLRKGESVLIEGD